MATAANTPTVVHSMAISTSVAARLTLSPETCFRQGTFPYFADEVPGMFLRIKFTGSEPQGDGDQAASSSPSSGEVVKREPTYLWVRIRQTLTAAGILESGSMSPDIDSHLPSANLSEIDELHFKAKVLQNPTYKWRGRSFEVYFLCEHPMLDLTLGSRSAAPSTTTAAAPNRLILVDLRCLAKHWEPTADDIKLFTSNFTHPPTDQYGMVIAAAANDAPMDPAALAAKYASVFLRVPLSPSDNTVRGGATDAQRQQETGKRSGPSSADLMKHYLPLSQHSLQSGADSLSASALMAATPEDASVAWVAHVSRFITARALSAADSRRLVEANSRLLDETGAGNAVLGYTAAQNQLLYQKYLSERKARESQATGLLTSSSLGQRGGSGEDLVSAEEILASAHREALRMTEAEGFGAVSLDMPGASDLKSAAGSPEIDSVAASSEGRFFNYVANPDRNGTLDSLVSLSKRNFKANAEKTVAGTEFFKRRVEVEGAYHIPAAGSVLWTVDRAERSRMCHLDIEAEYKKWEQAEGERNRKEQNAARKPLGYADDSRLDALIRQRIQRAANHIPHVEEGGGRLSGTQVIESSTQLIANDKSDDELYALAKARSSGNLGAASTTLSGSGAAGATLGARSSLLMRSFSGVKRARSSPEIGAL